MSSNRSRLTREELNLQKGSQLRGTMTTIMRLVLKTAAPARTATCPSWRTWVVFTRSSTLRMMMRKIRTMLISTIRDSTNLVSLPSFTCQEKNPKRLRLLVIIMGTWWSSLSQWPINSSSKRRRPTILPRLLSLTTLRKTKRIPQLSRIMDSRDSAITLSKALMRMTPVEEVTWMAIMRGEEDRESRRATTTRGASSPRTHHKKWRCLRSDSS